MVRAGETGGVLEASLDRISDQLEKDDELRRQVKGAMAYPIVVLTFALCVLIGLIAFIVPVFVKVFADFGGDLPLITKLTVQASERRHRPVVPADHRRHRRPDRLQEVASVRAGAASSGTRIRLKFPFKIGVTVQKISLARWSRTFAALVLRRRADHAGDRDHRPDRRQLRRREGDGRRHRVRQVRRLDRRPAQGIARSSPRWSPR